MQYQRLIAILLVGQLLVFISCQKEAKTPEKRKTDLDTSIVQRHVNPALTRTIPVYDSIFTRLFTEKKLPGAAIVITYKDSVLLEKGYGVQNTRTNTPVNTNTVFRIGSLSKGFASVLAGIDIQAGCFDWYIKIKDYVPYFKLKDSAQTERINLKHVLSHSSGLPRHAYTTLIEDGVRLEKIIPKLENLALIGREGEHLSYQNAAYCLVEKAMESMYDQPFEYILKNRLFEPMEMNSSGASYDAFIAIENKAEPHRYNLIKRKYIPRKMDKRFFNAIAAGGIYTSIHDMGTWLKVLQGFYPSIINNHTLNTIFEPVVKLGNRRYFRRWKGVKESYYALGWRTFQYADRKIIYHSGTVNNYRGDIAIDRKNQIGICVLFSATNKLASSSIPLFFETLDKELNKIEKIN